MPCESAKEPLGASLPRKGCGDVAEWSKALAWKVSIRQKRIEGSNPSVSATTFLNIKHADAVREIARVRAVLALEL